MSEIKDLEVVRKKNTKYFLIWGEKRNSKRKYWISELFVEFAHCIFGKEIKMTLTTKTNEKKYKSKTFILFP